MFKFQQSAISVETVNLKQFTSHINLCYLERTRNMCIRNISTMTMSIFLQYIVQLQTLRQFCSDTDTFQDNCIYLCTFQKLQCRTLNRQSMLTSTTYFSKVLNSGCKEAYFQNSSTRLQKISTFRPCMNRNNMLFYAYTVQKLSTAYHTSVKVIKFLTA